MAKKHKILLVEDDEYISRAYQAGLKGAGFEVVIARNGEEGIKKSKKDNPDLILLDLIMPKKNGYEVLAEIEKNEKTKNIPVIILTNLSDAKSVSQVMERGGDLYDFLIKSDWSIKDLVKRIKDKLKIS